MLGRGAFKAYRPRGGLTARRAQKYFAWPARFERLTSRILEVNADVLSLVELDRFEDFQRRLGDVYDGVFMRRPRPVSPDGSSLFWRKDAFKLVRHSAVTFVDRYNPVAVQDRCAVVALLERAEGGRTLFVSVHLAREKVGEPVRLRPCVCAHASSHAVVRGL